MKKAIFFSLGLLLSLVLVLPSWGAVGDTCGEVWSISKGQSITNAEYVELATSTSYFTWNDDHKDTLSKTGLKFCDNGTPTGNLSQSYNDTKIESGHVKWYAQIEGDTYYNCDNNGWTTYWQLQVTSTIDGDCPDEPSYCSNGVRDWDDVNEVWLEDGIDCGLSCSAPDNTCTTYCPIGFHIENRPPANQDVCYSDDDNADGYTVDAKLGICPNGYYLSATDSTKCISADLVTYASDDYLENINPNDEPDTTPWNEVVDTSSTNYNTTTYNTAGVITTIDTTTTQGTTTTGGQSSQDVTVTTVENPDGSKTVTTVEDNSILDSSGVLRGTSTTTTQTYDPNGDLVSSSTDSTELGSTDTANDAFNAHGLGGDFAGDTEGLSQFATRYQTFKTNIEGAPIYSPISTLFTGFDATGKNGVFGLNFGSYGSVNFDLATYNTTWAILGGLFVFMACVAAGRLVMVNK